MRSFPAAHQFLSELPGVTLQVPLEHCELPWMAELFSQLQTYPLFRRWRWLVTDYRQEIPFAPAPDVAVVYLGNEDFRLPGYVQQIGRLFTPYGHPFLYPFPQVCLIPLGCNGDVPDVPLIPFQQRRLDVFFAGHAAPIRRGFTQALQWLISGLQEFGPVPPQAMVALSTSFRSGLPPEAYGQCLADSRIVLVPRGCSPMTFRLFEAMRAGAIIVCNELPPTWFLEGLPRVTLAEDWRDLTETVMSLLSQPELMVQLHQQTREHYLRACAAAPVAAYMMAQLEAASAP